MKKELMEINVKQEGVEKKSRVLRNILEWLGQRIKKVDSTKRDHYEIVEEKAQRDWIQLKRVGITMDDENRNFLKTILVEYQDRHRKIKKIIEKAISYRAEQYIALKKYKYRIAILQRLLEDKFINGKELEEIKNQLEADDPGRNIVGGSNFRHFVNQCLLMRDYADKNKGEKYRNRIKEVSAKKI